MNDERIDLNDYNLEPFDIFQVLDGDLICTKCGMTPTRISIKNGNSHYPIEAFFGIVTRIYTKYGICSTGLPGDALFVAVKKAKPPIERWIIVHKDIGWATKEEAEEAIVRGYGGGSTYFEVTKIQLNNP